MRIKSAQNLGFYQKTRPDGGFTLVEMAITMSISALILVSILQVYMVYQDQYDRRTVRDNVVAANEALGNFFSKEGRYPCPANPTIPLYDENAGVEDCTLTEIDGARQTDATAALTPRPSKDPLLTGSLPFKTMGLPFKQSVDPWSNKLLYTVTKALTQKATFHDTYGAIRVETESGVSLTTAEDSVHYVVFSVGKNKAGGYLASGQRPIPCQAGLPESKNCELKETYVQGLLNRGAGSEYFDDMLMYGARSISKLWDFHTRSGGEVSTYYVNSGNVGVGVADPRTKLHVAGNVRSGKATQQLICDDSTPPRCWPAANFGGNPGTACGTAPVGSVYVAQGIRNGQIACSTVAVPLPKPTGPQECPAGQYVAGFTYTGMIVCKNP